MSAQQAAAALRPFYFAVHPDRFAQNPELRKLNEKSLQTFNGYLNALFPDPSSGQPPVEVRFSIKLKGSDTYENISISLSGRDPHTIVRTALQKCKLDTNNLPPRPDISALASVPRMAQWETEESLRTHMWQKEAFRSTRPRSTPRGRDLKETLSKIREDAIHRTENARKTTELLDDEIEYLKRKTGASMVKWTISWDQAYLRRCLMNVQHMIRQADRDTYEAIIHALNNHKLIFGRGTFICCDGSVQFGADEVPETWRKVCIEANVRRFELRNLELLTERVRDLFGTTHLIVDPLGHLLRTIQHLQSIIVRVSSRPKAETSEILQLAKGAVIEIVSAYSELNVTRDGRLQIPCNVDLQSLKDFLVAHSQRSQSMYSDMRRKKDDIQYLRTQCIKTMELSGLDWDSDLGPDLLLDCLNRLKNVNADTAETLRGLSVLLSTNPNVYVTNSGKISVPIDCL